MKNYIQSGDVLTLAAPYNRLSGEGALVGGIFGVAAYTVLSTAYGEFQTEGVFDLAKDTSTFADGDTVYWDNSAKVATSVTSNTIIGGAVLINPDGTSALGGSSGDATVRVRLNGMTIGTVAYGNLASSVLQTATVALSAAQLIAMGTTAVAILATPGSGKALIVENFLFEMTRSATAFTGGGAVSFQYHTTTTSVPHAGSIAATVVTGGAGTVQTYLGPNVGTNGLVIPSNEGIDITNATAAFAAGTGTAKVFVKYRVVTL